MLELSKRIVVFYGKKARIFKRNSRSIHVRVPSRVYGKLKSSRKDEGHQTSTNKILEARTRSIFGTITAKNGAHYVLDYLCNKRKGKNQDSGDDEVKEVHDDSNSSIVVFVVAMFENQYKERSIFLDTGCSKYFGQV